MSVFDLIRAMFGLSRSDDTDGTDVSVEYDAGSESADTEGADSEPGDGASGTETDRTAADEAAAAGTDATASTGSMTQSNGNPETAVEPAEAGAGVTEHSGTETPAAEAAEATGPVPDEPDAEIEAETETEPEPEEETASGGSEPDDSPSEGADAEPVDSVSGIGSAYADRLADAGVETVGHLLDADPEDLADRADISEKRIRRWQENASED